MLIAVNLAQFGSLFLWRGTQPCGLHESRPEPRSFRTTKLKCIYAMQHYYVSVATLIGLATCGCSKKALCPMPRNTYSQTSLVQSHTRINTDMFWPVPTGIHSRSSIGRRPVRSFKLRAATHSLVSQPHLLRNVRKVVLDSRACSCLSGGSRRLHGGHTSLCPAMCPVED